MSNSTEPACMPSKATAGCISWNRNLLKTVGGRPCVRALTPAICCHSSQTIFPADSPASTASTSNAMSGWKRRMGPVKFSGAGPASTNMIPKSDGKRRRRLRTTCTPAASSPFSSLPIPITARRGILPGCLSSLLLRARFFNASFSGFFQEELDILILAIVNHK